ncbi:hypothetical protein M3Y99_00949300 [Aphelenchoides fujianensis]|nr:hypothetical protein M3Y99_00949300 [Aphelenchoides fujianensis]
MTEDLTDRVPFGPDSEFPFTSAQEAFVEDRLTHWDGEARFSADGRFVYGFGLEATSFLTVDLVLHTQLVFECKDPPSGYALNFEVVSPRAVVVYRTDALWLLRLDVERRTGEWVELQRHAPGTPAYVLTEIGGAEVDVRRAVLCGDFADRRRFARLDVGGGRLAVDGEEQLEGARRAFRLSEDGRLLHALSFCRDPLDTLDVFDLEKRQWTSTKLSGGVERLAVSHCFWTRTGVYFCGYTYVDDWPLYSVFRCDLERREWRKLPLAARNIDRISALVSAETGEDEGLLLVCRKNGDRVEGVYRLLLRHPDPLVLLAATALRRSRLHVESEWGFRECMQKTRYNWLLRSLYPNMTPIPRS